MRLRARNLSLALAALGLLAAAVSGARAQAPVPMDGTVLKAGTREPISGATIDIYRTDIKGKYEAKTDKRGIFTYPLPQNGTFTIVVSAPGYDPQYRNDVRIGIGPKLEFELKPGSGVRPTLDDVNRVIKGGVGGKGEDPKVAEERARAEEEHAKALAEKEKFDARKIRFDAGVTAMQNKDYPTAITELSAAVEGLEGADPQFYAELGSVGGSNLAETHYRVAVELYNKKERDEAKQHLEAGAKAAALAVKFDPNKQVNYLIQGKILLLLVERFSVTDDAEAGAAAYLKAAEMETADPKKKLAYLSDAGDVYRGAYMTDKAIALYKQVLAGDPSNADSLYGIGLAAMASTSDDQTKQKEYYQTAADYLSEFVKKAASDDARATDAKGVLDTLAKDFKIKPRPLK
jgi:tetratricopeptide (TPR) repeat protein